MKFSVRTIIQLFNVLYRKKAPKDLTYTVWDEIASMKSAKRALRLLSPEIRKQIDEGRNMGRISTGEE